MAAGIDDIKINIPKLYFDHVDFALARGEDPDKLSKGLGINKMAIMDTNQDPATMAANVAYSLIKDNNLSPEDIGRMYISTESAFDESKPMNSFVIGMLEQVHGDNSFAHCGGVETKFACASGSYAIYDNINWIRAGEAEGKHAIVIASDVAKYDIGNSGESTQGAGAVGVLLNDNPRLLEFDPKVTATTVRDEYDFYKPKTETPVVHGHYSELLYLLQMRNTFDLYKEKAISTGLIKLEKNETVLDHIDYLNMHLPYSGMGKKAGAYLTRHEWRGLPRWKNITKQTGMEEPVPDHPHGTIGSIISDSDYMKRDHEFMKRFSKTKEYQEFYDNNLSSSLIASKDIGNLYTASMNLGFRSTLEFEHEKGVDLTGKRVGFGSYGSGSTAIVFSGVIQPEYLEIVGGMDLVKEIGTRRKLTLEEYEDIHEKRLPIENSVLNGKSYKHQFTLLDINKSKERMGERKYVFNE